MVPSPDAALALQANYIWKHNELSYEKPIRDSIAEMRDYYRRIIAMGKFREDQPCTPVTSETIATRLLDEDTPIRRHVELGQLANPYVPTSSLTPSSAFAAVSSRPKKAKGNYQSYQREIATG